VPNTASRNEIRSGTVPALEASEAAQ